jgi:penicillin-binding protein 2
MEAGDLRAAMFGGEVYQSGIGQGYDVVTPIQLITAYAALANGGTVYEPQVVTQSRT